MNRKLLSSSLALCLVLAVVSCSKDSSTDSGGGTVLTPLEKRADSLKQYVVGKHFVPVDFWSDTPIDYIEDDDSVKAETDLKKYILGYLADDFITFEAGGNLVVDQRDSVFAGKPATFTATWAVTMSKADNAVYLNYLDYYYEPRRYSLLTFTDTELVMFVDWTSTKDPTKKARLYTRFEKK